MSPALSSKQRHMAKQEMIERIEQGASVQQARSQSPISIHRTTVYRLLKRVQAEGEAGYIDGRHGHPIVNFDITLLIFRQLCCWRISPPLAFSANFLMVGRERASLISRGIA